MIEVLFPILLSEAVLGGGGRTFSIGPISLRMILFAAAVMAALFGMFTSTRRRDGLATAGLLVLLFIASLLPGLLVDAAEGTPVRIIGPQLQPLLFWLSVPFFALALQDLRSVKKASSILLYAGLFVAISTFFVTIGLYLGIVGFGSLYVWGADTEELIFRGTGTFFYKGHFFVGISLIFCLTLRPAWWRVMAFIMLASLILSLTRGLYLAVAIAILFTFISQRRFLYIAAGSLFIIAVAAFYSDYIFNILFDPTRAGSAQTRASDLSYFIAIFDYNILLFGDGFGSLINQRSIIENSYIWALWKFGISGVLFMVFPLFLSAKYYLSIKRSSDMYPLASAYFFGVVMLYTVTAFNPFINNSIGLIYLFTALFSLRRISRIAHDSPLVADTRAFI